MERNKKTREKKTTPVILADRFLYAEIIKVFHIVLEPNNAKVYVLIVYLQEILKNLPCKIKSNVRTEASDPSIKTLAC